MAAAIIKNRVDGTRITVWDVYQYVEAGWSDEQIMGVLPLSLDQLRAAKRYIEENLDYVREGHRQIEERNAKGNSPEVMRKLEQSQVKMQAWLAQRKEQSGAGTAR